LYGEGYALKPGDLIEYVMKGFSTYSIEFGGDGLRYEVGIYDIYVNGRLIAEEEAPSACILPNPLYPRGMDFWREMKRVCGKSSFHFICNVEILEGEAVFRECLYSSPPTWTESVGYVEVETGLLRNYTWYMYEYGSGKLLQSYSLVLVEPPEPPIRGPQFLYPQAKRGYLPMPIYSHIK